jgi:hypothetical protein
MSRALAPATSAALNAGDVGKRTLILFDFGSGLYGFWSGVGTLSHDGVDYLGAGSLISIDDLRQTSSLDAVQVVARLTGVPNSDLTPDTLATIENEHYHQRPCTISTAYFSTATGALLSVELEFDGVIDRMPHFESEDGTAVLEAHLESRFVDHRRSDYRVRSDGDQKRIHPSDEGLRHVTIVATERVVFGRSESPAPTPQRKKKGFLERFFG